MNARALTAWWRVMCRTRNRKTLSVFEGKRGRAAGEQWGFCDSTDPAWPEVNVTLMWRKRKWASFLQLHQHFISNNAIKQTAPGSRAELQRSLFSFLFLSHLSVFTTWGQGIVISIRLLPVIFVVALIWSLGKSRRKDCEPDEKASWRRVHFFIKFYVFNTLLQSKMSHSKPKMTRQGLKILDRLLGDYQV